MTNYEKIKNMTIEEMTEFVSFMLDTNHCPPNSDFPKHCRRFEYCSDCCKDWLEQEAEE